MKDEFTLLLNSIIPCLHITKKETTEDYVTCILNMYQYITRSKNVTRDIKRNTLSAALHANPAIGLRFVVEMERIGMLSSELVRRSYKETHCYVTITPFFNKLLESTETPTVHVRHPIKASDTQDHFEVRSKGELLDVVKDDVLESIVESEFTINEFTLKLLKDFPKYTVKDKEFISYSNCIEQADEYANTNFKFPLFYCSRGRIYTNTTVGFNLQGADHEKALVLSTYAEPLNEVGLAGLREAALGYAELDLTDEQIVSYATNPSEDTSWLDADKPYCFMACAELLRQYYEDPTKPLPAFTPLDGRCSGLQHLSAMFKTSAITDRLGMEVNEASDGLDIYEYVASEYSKELDELHSHFITRKLAKIPTLLFGYSGTRHTVMQEVDDLVGTKNIWIDGKWTPIEGGLDKKHSTKIGSGIFDMTNTILKPMVNGKEWLKACASIITKKTKDTTIQWLTPDKFLAKSIAYKEEVLTVNIRDTNGKKHTISLQVPQLDLNGDKIASLSKAQSAIAANLVHSLDATHLRMVQRRLKALGLPSIFIHDSFATHSNYREVLYTIIVEEFIALYSGNYMADLKAYWEDTYQVELPTLPEMGDYNVNQLLDCKEFFK